MNKSGNIVGVGYNRFPKGFGDDDVDVTWDKGDKDPAKNKYPYGTVSIGSRAGCSKPL